MSEPEDQRAPDLDDLESEEGWDSNFGSVDEAVVLCPHCGESSVIAIDPGGGDEQEYIEDCPVCCRPWHVHLRFESDGTPRVSLGEA